MRALQAEKEEEERRAREEEERLRKEEEDTEKKRIKDEAYRLKKEQKKKERLAKKKEEEEQKRREKELNEPKTIWQAPDVEAVIASPLRNSLTFSSSKKEDDTKSLSITEKDLIQPFARFQSSVVSSASPSKEPKSKDASQNSSP